MPMDSPAGAPMENHARWRRYLRFWGADVDADIDDELRFHLDMRTRDLIERGWPPDAAREAALARFGDRHAVTATLHAHDIRQLRMQRRADTMSAFWQDLRYATRRLRQAPGFAVGVVLVLAIGVGATTAIFSVVSAAILRPLPYRDPATLVTVRDLQGESDETPASYPELLDWQAGSDVFSDVAGYFRTSSALTGAGDPERLDGVRMSARLPGMLGIVPLLGRSFLPEEDVAGTARVVMISEALWRRRFSADPGIPGRTITLGGQPHTIIGVIPHGTAALMPTDLASGTRSDFWAPLRLTAENAPRGLHFITVVGRLRPGLALASARERLDVMAARLRADGTTTHGVRIAPLADLVVGTSGQLMLILAGAVTMLLLIACANVANLLLARGAGRTQEMALRGALGATRGRLVALLLVENTVLALCGGLAGIALAYGGVAWLRAIRPSNLPRLGEATIDGGVLLFAVGLSVLTGLIFGLVPAIRTSRSGPGEALKSGGHRTGESMSSDRLRRALIVAEVALSFVLLIGAGLLVRSLEGLMRVDKGYDARGVLSMQLVLPQAKYSESARQLAFYRQVKERVAALPGIDEIGFALNLPLEGGVNGGFGIEGRTFPPGEGPTAFKAIVGAGFFEVLHASVVGGRTFDDRDRAGAPPVIVVNEAFARRFFAGASPLGKRIDFSWDTQGMQEIIGVIRDMREGALDSPAEPTMYVPLEQRPSDAMFMLVRTSVDPAAVIDGVRRVMLELDRDLPVARIRPLADLVTASVAGRRVPMSMLGVFSIVALLLAAVGLYATISYSVAQRQREIGIRVALGAEAGQVVRGVLGSAFVLIGIGVGVGSLLALWLSRFLAGLLYGVEARDPITFVGVALVIAVVALVASYLPALWASRVDPMVVLRGE